MDKIFYFVVIFINFVQFSTGSALLPQYPHYRYPSDLILPPTTFKPIEHYSRLRGLEAPKDISWRVARNHQPVWKATYLSRPTTTSTTSTTTTTIPTTTTTTTATLLPPPVPTQELQRQQHFEVVFPKPSIVIVPVRVPEARMNNFNFHPASQSQSSRIIDVEVPSTATATEYARIFAPQTNSFSTMLRNSNLLTRHAQEQEQREREQQRETLERPRSSNIVKKELSLQSLDEFVPEETMVNEMEVEAPSSASAPTPSTASEILVRREDMMQAFATPEPSPSPTPEQQEQPEPVQQKQHEEIAQPDPTPTQQSVSSTSSAQPENHITIATTTPSSSESDEFDDDLDFKELLNIFAPKQKNGKDGKESKEPQLSLNGLLKEAFLLSSLLNGKDSDLPEELRDPTSAPRPTTPATTTTTTNPLYTTLKMMSDWQNNDSAPPTQPPPLPRPLSSRIPIVSFPEGENVRPSSPQPRAPQFKPGDILSQILGESSQDDEVEGEYKFVIPPPYVKPGTQEEQPPKPKPNKSSSTTTLISQFLPLVPNALRSLASFGRPVLAQNPRTGLYYWIDMNTFLASENNAEDSAPVSRGLRARLGEKDRFIRIFQRK